MRILEFTVNGQRLKRASGCSFNHIIMGSKNFLRTRFTFRSSEWPYRTKIVVFKTSTKTEYIPLNNMNECDIPDVITSSSAFTIQIIGVSGEQRVPTNEVTIRQEEL